MENRKITRLKRELQLIHKNKEEFVVDIPDKSDISKWYVTFECPSDTIYTGEKYKLRFLFPDNYLLKQYFTANLPITNMYTQMGSFVCPFYMMVFQQGWSAAMNVGTVCRSIISMLSSAKKKSRPQNDKDLCVRSQGKGPKDFIWTYEDDDC